VRLIYAALIGPHHAGQFQALTLRGGQRALRSNIEPNINVQAQLMALVSAGQWATPRPRNILDKEVSESRRMRLCRK
jgi:hypothetical protein